jgi:prepilin-type N-terminal cleavage/methylation domain-containing protein
MPAPKMLRLLAHKKPPPNGFTLIEALISMLIFSILLNVVYTVHSNTLIHIAEGFKIHEMQSKLNQAAETLLVYPSFRSESDDAFEPIKITEYPTYYTISTCCQNHKKPCLSLALTNLKTDFL